MTKYVSYRRVSTLKQGRSGLGMEAQEKAVADYVTQTGGLLLRDFVETESGKVNDRPQLMAALSFAKRSRATLVVAKLDRLSRNVAFLATLMESGVDFIAIDNPHATPFTIHILAAVAEWERSAISKRTREAMAMARARGRLFGSSRTNHWAGREHQRLEGARRGGAKAATCHRKNADEAYKGLSEYILQLRFEGLSLQGIADRLNLEQQPTRYGKQWHRSTVSLVLKRFAQATASPDEPPTTIPAQRCKA